MGHEHEAGTLEAQSLEGRGQVGCACSTGSNMELICQAPAPAAVVAAARDVCTKSVALFASYKEN